MQLVLLFYLKHGGLVSSIGADIIWGGCSFVVVVRKNNSLNIRPVVIMFELLLLCLILAAAVFVLLSWEAVDNRIDSVVSMLLFYYRSNWFNRLLLLRDLFLVLLLLFVYVIGSMFQFQILRFDSSFGLYLSAITHIVRVCLSDPIRSSDLFPIYPAIHTLSECDWVISGSNSSTRFVRRDYRFVCRRHGVRVSLSYPIQSRFDE